MIIITSLLCLSTIFYPIYAAEQSEKTSKKYMLIQAPGASKAKVVTAPEEVEKIRLAYKRVEKLYEDVDFFGVYDDDELDYYIYSIENGLRVKVCPCPNYDYTDFRELKSVVKSASKTAKDVYIYNFSTGDPQKYLSLMKGLISRKDLNAFYPDSTLTSQYPYIELEYRYNNAENNYKYTWKMFSDQKNFGEFACDNIFKSAIKYLEDKAILFELSKVEHSQAMSGDKGYEYFNRRIQIYVTRPLKADEKTYIEKIWLKKLTDTPYYTQKDLSTPYKYIEAPQSYPIVLLSSQSLKQKDIAELEKTYGLKYAS